MEPFRQSALQTYDLKRQYNFLPYFIILLSITSPTKKPKPHFPLFITSFFGLYGFHITIFPISSPNSLSLDYTIVP